ncbi:helix-turn-helix domain-containing protein [Xylella fastidiosa subsp. multiplex]|nr:helix-turn-helix domain-containing protein [Xylella fastidiosa]MDC6418452.1 helix-turn-helix domain-containing protein [Xylella fastidiosa subsp. multiplex]
MSNERFTSVWDAIEDTPEAAENMKLRSALMMALKQHIETAALSQSQAAKLFGVTQPRVSDLMRGKINLFGLDATGQHGCGGWYACGNARTESGVSASPVFYLTTA